VRGPSVGPISERTPNDERISSVLHEQNITLPRPPFSRPKRRNAERLRNLDLFREPFRTKATECAAVTKAANLPDVVT